MTYKLLDAQTGMSLKVPVNEKEFEIFVTEYQQYGDFASVMIKDPDKQDLIYTEGVYESNGVRFLFRWDMEYSTNRDNYIHNNTLLVDVL